MLQQRLVLWHTIDGERFAWLHICGFSAIKVFMNIRLRSLGHNCSLFSKIKEKRLYSQKNFCGMPENCEKCESLAQQIFPHLRYVLMYFKVISKANCKAMHNP